MYKVQVTPVIGLPQADGWSHVATNQGRSLVWVLSLHGNHVRNVGRDFLDLINETPPQDAAEFYQLFQNLVAETKDKDCELSCAAAFFDASENKSVFMTYHAQIMLRRGEKVGALLESQAKAKVIQGNYQEDDLFIFATEQATQFIEEIKIKMKQGYETDSIVTSLTPSLQLQENTSLSALGFVSIQQKQAASNRSEPIENQMQSAESEEEEIEAPVESLPIVGPQALESDESAFNDEVYLEDDEIGQGPLLSETTFNEAPFAEAATEPVPPATQLTEKEHIIDLEKISQSSSTFFRQGIQQLLPLGKRITYGGLHISKQLYAVCVTWSKQVLLVGKQVIDGLLNRDVYVTPKRTRLIMRYVLLGLLIIGIIGMAIFGFNWRRSQHRQEIQNLMAPFSTQIDEAEASITETPISARDQLVALIDELTALEQTYADDTVALGVIEQVTARAEQLYQEVAGREELQELPIFLDLSAVQDGFVTTHAGISQNSAWFVDSQTNQLIQLDVETQESQVRSLQRDETDDQESAFEISDISVRPINQALAILTSNEGVIQFRETNEQTSLLSSEDVLDSSKLLAAFGDSVYTFNAEERMIFRYTATEDGFEEADRWLRGTQGIDFDAITSMVIDGDIWLADRQGSISQLRSGQPQEFSVNGLEKPFESTLLLYTTDEIENLYVLEADNSRLVILNKEGVFQREIVSASLAAGSNVLVNADETKALIVSGSTIFEVSL